MDSLIAVAAALLYLFAIGMIVPGLVHQTGIRTKMVFISALLALIFHGLLLHDLIHTDGVAGQNLSILNVASVISFIVSLVMSIAMLKTRIWFLLPIVYSFSVINLLASTFVPGTVVMHFEGQPGLLSHISLALFSYATLTIGTLYAIQLAWLDYKLKAKKAMVMNPNLPPLLKIERQLFNIILIGTILLTLTLISGFVFLEDMFAQGKAHKAVFSMIAWVVYAVLLWGHYQKGWRGRKVTWYSVIGASLLTLAYFGSRFVSEVILS